MSNAVRCPQMRMATAMPKLNAIHWGHRESVPESRESPSNAKLSLTQSNVTRLHPDTLPQQPSRKGAAEPAYKTDPSGEDRCVSESRNGTTNHSSDHKHASDIANLVIHEARAPCCAGHTNRTPLVVLREDGPQFRTPLGLPLAYRRLYFCLRRTSLTHRPVYSDVLLCVRRCRGLVHRLRRHLHRPWG